MCGIAGFIDSFLPNEEFLKSCGERMAKSIEHRGPNDSGVWIDKTFGICLAHKRLSIIDLSVSGHQPMISRSGRYVIVFNGEIYNHLEIRKEIDKYTNSLISWNGSSDTETLLQAFEEFGLEKTLNICVGMFAFAIWDRKEKVLHLARDRFGEKPLYWGRIKANNQNDYKLVFASEISAIWQFPGLEKSINIDAMNSFFQLGYVKPPNSIQNGIFQLLPGNYLSIDFNFISNKFFTLPEQKTWYNSLNKFSSIYRIQKDQNISQNELLDGLENVLEQSVISQSKADVTVGTFLSGGIDSTLITSLLQKNSTRKIKTFNISFPDIPTSESIYDEGPFARAISNHLNTDHTEVNLSSTDAIQIIKNIAYYYSEPFADSSQVPTFLVCKEAKDKGLSVAITGDGGDELFGGYNRHKLIPQIHNIFQNMPKSFNPLVSNFLEDNKLINMFLSKEKLQKLSKAIKNSSELDNIYSTLTTKGMDIEELLLKNKIPFSMDFFTEIKGSQSISEIIMINDLIRYLPYDILVKVDRASMANSLETRAPFLDYRVAEYAWSIPIKYKIFKKGISTFSKYPLRKILNKYLPPNLTNRKKNGFSMPIGNWLKGPLKGWAEELLNSNELKSQNLLNEKYIKNIWDDHLSNRQDNTEKLWTILMWQSWLRKWN